MNNAAKVKIIYLIAKKEKKIFCLATNLQLVAAFFAGLQVDLASFCIIF